MRGYSLLLEKGAELYTAISINILHKFENTKHKKEIRKWREKYESVANENGQDHPIMVEGETTAGYFCQLMVNPQEVAKIFVDYDYALYRVLGEDAPDAMWEDLGRKFGLEHVCSVDL